ncbi:4'-phosphopantetheinyl transferase [Nonomuraea sp. NPDC050153]|uniref:4'-phosphopantetheinyl transferase n=1 Tax=Nonomuraea sp. NPDC050153 TaxID=3364359 RepID=UPI0037ADF656
MIDEILPPWVAAAELFGDPPDITLLPEEEALVSDSAEKRQREFRTSRHCAHLALRQLGVNPRPILRGDRGAPTWPPGVVGSITHCTGYRAAAVAHGALSIGIDAEPHLPMPTGVLERTATPAEAAALDLLGLPNPGRLLFSAKESIYKAWYPLTGHWLGFLDAKVTFATSQPPPPSPHSTTPTPTPQPAPNAPSHSAQHASDALKLSPRPAPPAHLTTPPAHTRALAEPGAPATAAAPAAAKTATQSGTLTMFGTFNAEIAAHGPGWPTHFEGRWLVSSGLILTAIAVPALSA